MAVLKLSELRARAVYRVQADVGPDERHTSDMLDAMINDALEEYHLIRTGTTGGHPESVTRGTATTSASTTVTLGWPLNEYITLPSDFLSLLSMRIQPDVGRWVGMEPFSERQRNDYEDTYYYYDETTTTGLPRYYRLANDTSGNDIARLYPPADAAYTIEFTYVPTPTLLVADDDPYNFYPGTQDYVVCGAAIRILESDGIQEGPQYNALVRRKDECEQTLKKYVARKNRSGTAHVRTGARRL